MGRVVSVAAAIAGVLHLSLAPGEQRLFAQGAMKEFGLPGESVTCLSAEWEFPTRSGITARRGVFPQPLYAGTQGDGVFRILPFDTFPGWRYVGLRGYNTRALNLQHWGAGPGDYLSVFASAAMPTWRDSSVVLTKTGSDQYALDSSWSSADSLLNKKTLRTVNSVRSWYYSGHEPPQPYILGGSNGIAQSFLSTWTSPALDSVVVHELDNDSWGYALAASGSVNGRAVVSTSANWGLTWHSTLLPSQADTTAYCVAMDPGNPDTMFAGTPSGVWRTTDHGETWNRLLLQGIPIHVLVVDPLQHQTVYAGCRDSSGIFESIDAGDSWKFRRAAPGRLMGGTTSIAVLYPRDNDVQSSVFIGTLGTGVWLYQPSGITPVSQTGDGTPATFRLSQNIPNPFNPETAISYQLPAVSHVVLNVYDVLGREVATLVDEEKPAGSYRAQFNASGLASGVYFCRMETSSPNGSSRNFVQVKKMLVLR